MADIDHLVFACTDLAAGVSHIEELTGVTAAPGGPHPGVGTYNALLSLGEDVYLEIIAPDPNQPDPEGPRPFGIDDLAPESRRLVGFAIHATPPQTIDEVVAAMASNAFDPGRISAMSRVKPDGDEIHWRLTLNAAARSCFEPFVIDWGTTTHPSKVTPTGATLISLNGSTTDPAAIRQMHSAIGLTIDMGEGPDEISAVLECPNGRVELR